MQGRFALDPAGFRGKEGPPAGAGGGGGRVGGEWESGGSSAGWGRGLPPPSPSPHACAVSSRALRGDEGRTARPTLCTAAEACRAGMQKIDESEI